MAVCWYFRIYRVLSFVLFGEDLNMQLKNGCFNSLPNNKFLDWSKLKAFVNDKINATEKFNFVLGRVENIVEKGENAGYQHFLLFIRPSKTGRIMGSPVAGGRRPVLCPEHISKTTLARVMKFHGWIDLIQGECSAQES